MEPNFRGVVMVGDMIHRKSHGLPLYLTDRYQIQPASLRAKALGQKHGMKASPQAKAWSEGKPSGERMFFFLGTWARYDIYQSNIKARHVIFSIYIDKYSKFPIFY